MCLAAFAIAQSSRFPWVLASNRDEFFARPAAPLAWWTADGAAVLSGRDLSAGGTWLAVDARGHLALVTNVREPGRHDPAAPSRGALVLQGLQCGPRDEAALRGLSQSACNGFNLVVADLRSDAAAWASNRAQPQHRLLGAGLHGMSNAALNTPWPKLVQLKRRLQGALPDSASVQALAEQAFAALADRSEARDDTLPTTGVTLLRERQLSPAFIRMQADDGAVYGTRCSTLVIVEQQGSQRVVNVIERCFDASGAVSGETSLAFELS